MAWSHLQSVSKAATGTASSSQSVTFTTANLTSGSKMICALGWASGSTVTVSSVKDGAGNAFTRMAGAPNAGGPSGCDLWQLDTPSGDAGTKPTITAQFSGSVQASMLVQEVSGLATGTTTAAVLDGTAGTKTGSGGSSTGSPTYSSTASNEYLVTVYGDDGGPETLGTPSPPGTKDAATVSANSDADVGIGYGNSTGTTEAGSWPLSGSSAEWGVILVAFQLAAGGGTTNGTASLTAASSLTAAAIETIEAAAGLTAASSLAAAALDETLAAAALTAASSMTAAGTEATAGAASLTAASSVAAAGISETLGAAALVAASSLTAGGVETIRGAAALTAASAVSAAATETVAAAAALTAAGSVSAAASLPTPGAAALVAESSMTATGTYAAPPFPQTPLNLMYELLINGTWTDVSSYVYERDDQVVTRGHPDESTTTSPSTLTLTLNNRDGRFSSKNPLGAYYPYIGRNTQIRCSVPEGASYLRLEDDAVSYAQCPGTGGVSITGDTEIHLDVTLDSWRTNQTLAAKWAQTSNERSWLLTLNESGTLALRWSPDGTNTNSVVAVSTLAAPWPGLRRQAIKVTLAVASGTVTFYTAPAGADQVTLGPITTGFVQLGTAVVVGADSVFNSTAPVQLGEASDAAEYSAYAGVNGKIHAFTLLSGIGGTTEASPNFTTQTAGATSFTDAQSNTWTMEGTSEISDRRYRAYMEASGWPQNWDPTGADVWVSLAAAGILRRITQGAGTRPLQSAFRRALPSAIGLVGYWPAEDGNDQTGAGATPAAPQQIASAIQGGYAGTFSGKPTFASDSSFLCSYPLPVLNGSRWRFRLPGRSADNSNVFRFLMQVPSTDDTDTGIVARMYTTGTIGQLVLQYGQVNSGSLQLLGYDQAGNQLFASGYIDFTADGVPINGSLLWVSMELRPSGGSVAYSVTILEVGATTGFSGTGTQSSASVGNATTLIFNGDLTHALQGTAIGHITYQSQWQSLFNFGSQLDAWIGETAGQRFSRLCGEQSIPFRAVGDLDDTVLMGAQTPLALTDLLQECEDADRGTIYEPRQAFALGYRTRASMQNQAAGVTISYSATELGGTSQEMTTTEDDQYTVNDAVVVNSYTGGSAEVQVTTGALSVQDPPDGVGIYQQAPQINLAYDSQCVDLAGWLTWLGTVDDPRYPVLPLSLARPALSGLYYDVQDLDIGDRIVVTGTPAWLPPDGITQIMQGTTETLNSYKYELDWQGVPELPYESGLVGDAVYGRVDTDGSTLHANATSTATSITVDTTPGTPTVLWTTAAADFPFDIAIGGERITVTSITGTSSPQTFTVTRSVNGVVKAQTAGTDVRLFYPTIVSL